MAYNVAVSGDLGSSSHQTTGSQLHFLAQDGYRQPNLTNNVFAQGKTPYPHRIDEEPIFIQKTSGTALSGIVGDVSDRISDITQKLGTKIPVAIKSFVFNPVYSEHEHEDTSINDIELFYKRLETQYFSHISDSNTTNNEGHTLSSDGIVVTNVDATMNSSIKKPRNSLTSNTL